MFDISSTRITQRTMVLHLGCENTCFIWCIFVIVLTALCVECDKFGISCHLVVTWLSLNNNWEAGGESLESLKISKSLDGYMSAIAIQCVDGMQNNMQTCVGLDDTRQFVTNTLLSFPRFVSCRISNVVVISSTERSPNSCQSFSCVRSWSALWLSNRQTHRRIFSSICNQIHYYIFLVT